MFEVLGDPVHQLVTVSPERRRVHRVLFVIEANPNFLISGTASAFVAPAQATVVSTRAKFVMPGTVSFVTLDWADGADWDRTAAAVNASATKAMRVVIMEPPVQEAP